MLFLRRAGTVILALSIAALGAGHLSAHEPAPGTPADVAQEQQLEQSILGRIGHVIEPVVRPLGYDWKIGVSLRELFAAREVFVSTMGTIYGVGSDEDERARRSRAAQAERDPRTGRPAYDRSSPSA